MRAHPAGERPSSQDLGRHLNDTREGATPTGPGAASQARGQQCEGPGPGWAWRARARGRAEDRGRGETLSGLCCHTKHGAGLAGRGARGEVQAWDEDAPSQLGDAVPCGIQCKGHTRGASGWAGCGCCKATPAVRCGSKAGTGVPRQPGPARPRSTLLILKRPPVVLKGLLHLL